MQKYKFLDNIATADVAFEAYGKNLPDLFANCAQALTEVIVDVELLSDKKHRVVSIIGRQIDDLLYDFLSELIFLKDTKGFLARSCEVTINNLPAEVPLSQRRRGTKAGQQSTTCPPKPWRRRVNNYHLEAKCFGDKIDPSQHEFKVDVKAVTMHEFGVRKTKEGYKARVVLDV